MKNCAIFRIKLERGIGFLEQMRRFRKIGRDRSGIAAVEFALILPFMMLLYLGTAELTYGLMANRKMTFAARALSDLVAQTQSPNNITNANLDAIFSAASAIMSPFDVTPLKMSVSSIEFVPNTATPPVYTAKTIWTAVYTVGSTSKGVARPCGATALTQASNTATPSSTTMPAGLYGAGSVIVADVSYTFSPPFSGSTFTWGGSGGIDFAQTTYMRPRSQTKVDYTVTSPVTAGRTKCP